MLPSELPVGENKTDEDSGKKEELTEEEKMQKALSQVAHTLPQATPLIVQDTFAMIKPLIAEANYDEIMSIIAAHGFTVVSELKTKMSITQAKLFYEEHAGKDFFEDLVGYMTSGPVVALHLRREYAIGAWRHLIGPTNLDKAKQTRPDSIRAMFALDGTRNACHGSDSPYSAAREINFFFTIGVCAPDLLNPSALGVSTQKDPENLSSNKIPSSAVPPDFVAPKRYSSKVKTVPTINSSDIALMEAYANYDVEPVMKELLRKLMVDRPVDVTGFALQQLAEMHVNNGKEMPLFPDLTSQPMNRLNPIMNSPRGSKLDDKDPLPAIEADGDSMTARHGDT
jgi:nucleoside-diphosphate kinase